MKYTSSKNRNSRCVSATRKLRLISLVFPSCFRARARCAKMGTRKGKSSFPLSFLFFFFLSPFLLSLSTSQVEIGRASKAPNNTQSRSRLLPLPPLDIQAKWNAFVALRYRSTRVTHFISIQRGSVRLWPVLSRWQNGW